MIDYPTNIRELVILLINYFYMFLIFDIKMLNCYDNGGEDGLYPRCKYSFKGAYIIDDIQASQAAIKYIVMRFTSEDDFNDFDAKNCGINEFKNAFKIDTNNMSEVD
jgi:hypothetical protein